MLRKKTFLLLVMATALLFTSLATATSAGDTIYVDYIGPPDGPPGTEVWIIGGGATPGGVVVALFSGPLLNITVDVGPLLTITVGWAIAEKDGYWEIWFIAPSVSPGEYVVYVVDNETQTSASTTFFVTPKVVIPFQIDYISPQSGPVGTIVYVSGSGATPKGEVRVYFDETNVANTTAMDGVWWSVSFEVPDVEPGEYTITALDVAANTEDAAVFTVTPPPTINVSPSEAPIGSKITISGEGFTPNEGIFVTFEDLLLFSPIPTDEKGEFNVTLFVPMINSGNYTIKAISMYYTTQAVANTTFTVTLGVDTLLSQYKQTHGHSNSKYNRLLSDFNELESKLEGLTGELGAARNLSYIFIVTTIIFIATTVYLAMRKPRMRTELKAT